MEDGFILFIHFYNEFSVNMPFHRLGPQNVFKAHVIYI